MPLLYIRQDDHYQHVCTTTKWQIGASWSEQAQFSTPLLPASLSGVPIVALAPLSGTEFAAAVYASADLPTSRPPTHPPTDPPTPPSPVRNAAGRRTEEGRLELRIGRKFSTADLRRHACQTTNLGSSAGARTRAHTLTHIQIGADQPHRPHSVRWPSAPTATATAASRESPYSRC